MFQFPIASSKKHYSVCLLSFSYIYTYLEIKYTTRCMTPWTPSTMIGYENDGMLLLVQGFCSYYNFSIFFSFWQFIALLRFFPFFFYKLLESSEQKSKACNTAMHAINTAITLKMKPISLKIEMNEQQLHTDEFSENIRNVVEDDSIFSKWVACNIGGSLFQIVFCLSYVRLWY